MIQIRNIPQTSHQMSYATCRRKCQPKYFPIRSRREMFSPRLGSSDSSSVGSSNTPRLRSSYLQRREPPRRYIAEPNDAHVCRPDTQSNWINSDVHHDNAQEPATHHQQTEELRAAMTTDWNAGATSARDTMAKPEARTAKDWNKPATARVPPGRESVTARPMSRTMKDTHSTPL